jgi:hypothetical protein
MRSLGSRHGDDSHDGRARPGAHRLLRNAGYSPKTTTMRLRVLAMIAARIGGRSLAEVTRLDLEEFLTRPSAAPRAPWEEPKPLKPASRSSYRSHVQAFFKWALDAGHIEEDPPGGSRDQGAAWHTPSGVHGGPHDRTARGRRPDEGVAPARGSRGSPLPRDRPTAAARGRRFVMRRLTRRPSSLGPLDSRH